MKDGCLPTSFDARGGGGGGAAVAVPPAPPPTLCENASVVCGYHLQLFDEQFADPVINKIKTGISHLAILLSAVKYYLGINTVHAKHLYTSLPLP